MKLNSIVVLMFSLIMLTITSCNSEPTKNTDSGSETTPDESNEESFSFKGRVISWLVESVISSAHAAESMSSICDSTCSESDQTKCVKLYIVNDDQSETLLCKTNLLSDSTYTFNIVDKASLANKPLKVSIDNYNGESRTLVTAVKESTIESRTHNLSKSTTFNADSILADLLRRKGNSESVGNSIEEMVVDIAQNTGANHNCVLFGSGKIKCWGYNSYGELGLGDNQTRGDNSSDMGTNLPYIDLGTNRTAVQVAVGDRRTCAVLDNAKLKCWGFNSSGQLGLGDSSVRGDSSGEMGDNLPNVNLGTGRTVKNVTMGVDHTCALLDNDKVKCWGGANSLGELGIGSVANNVGDETSEMGDNLAYVDLGTGRTVTQLTSGNRHNCAILDNGKVKCWGANASDILGIQPTVAYNPGVSLSHMGDNLDYVPLGTGRTAKQIKAGYNFTCALLDNDNVKCWGQNSLGNLGYGNTTSVGTTNTMGDYLAAVDLGTGRTAKQIAIASGGSVCAVLDNGFFTLHGGRH